MKKLSVIIPVYNEEKTIAEIIRRVLAVNLPKELSREIIIVDDGSFDQTSAILKSFSHPLIKIFQQHNQGKTSALLLGFSKAAGDIVLIQDADLEYDPAQYPTLLAPILENQCDVVYGSRFLGTIEKMFFANRAANRISNMALRLLYGVNITDVNTCFKVFKREVLEGINIVSKNFAFETEITVKLIKRNIRIKEVPITYVARSVKEGKKINWLSAFEMFWPILKYRFQK